MPALSLQPTFPIFTDIDGQPLEAGYIFIGVANLAPIGNPINVYWDAALTLPAAQPIRTIGGYPVNAGTPARLYVNSDYSIQVQNRNGSVVYSAPAATERYSGEVIEITFNDVTGQLGSDRVNFLQAGTGAVTRTAQAKMRDTVSVFDFMTAAQIADVQSGAASLDVTAAFTNALATGKNVHAPAGTYRLNALPLASNACLFGDGMRRTIFIPAAGATSVLLVDATSAAKQNVTIQDVCIKNPNNVLGCYGIWFKGTNVTSINDQHNLMNIEIGPSGWEGTSYAFSKGIYVTARLIAITATNIYISRNTINWHSATDPSTPAFNANVFVQCVFAEAAQQGFLHTGQSTNVKFIAGHTQQNNTLNVAGVAGMDVSDTFNWDIDTHGFEANGFGAAVDGSNPLNNSISFLHRGTVCFGLSIHGGYFTDSGANIVIGPTVSNLQGGRIENNYLNCLTNGFNFATLSQSNSHSVSNPIVFTSTNAINGKVSPFVAGIGINAAFEQNQGMGYLTGAVSDIDLLRTSNFICNPSGPFTISTIKNMLPGCELTIINTFGASTVTIAGALMVVGAANNVLTGTIAKFKVQGGPIPGVFVRIQ